MARYELWKAAVAFPHRFVVRSRCALHVPDAPRDSRRVPQVVGDAFAATTHSDLVLRAKGIGCKVKHIYNASIMNAVAGCGLQLYRFGQAISIVFFTQTWRGGC